MKIVDMGMNGEGIAKEKGKVYFVDGAILGEDVEVEIFKDKKTFCEAKLVNVLKKSPDRIKPKCEYFGRCGGCQLQHLAYVKQLELKENIVKNTFKKVAGLDVEILPAVSSDLVFNYRNKSVFRIFEEHGKTKLGMIDKNFQPFEVWECKIAKEEINKVVKVFSVFLENKKPEGCRYLVVRSCGGILVTIVTNGSRPTWLGSLSETLKDQFQDISLNLNINKSEKTILSEKFENVFGKDCLTLSDFGLQYSVNSASFLQVNDNVKKKLYDEIKSEFLPTESVVDAYCGTGLLSACLAQKVQFCHGIEICRPAVHEAEKLKWTNGLLNLKFTCGDCKNEIKKILDEIKGDFSVVLDPPKKGCDLAVLQRISELNPRKIVYVACSPISLARDVKFLTEKGYVIEKIRPFDMFPNTSEIETLAVLSCKKTLI